MFAASMATYAIGDIHGCLTALTSLADAVQFQPDDTIVFLGDYIDRGPNSKGVIDWLLEFEKEHNAVFLKGNHEIMMLAARSSQAHLAYWLGFGGAEVLDSYGIGDDSGWALQIPAQHWDFVDRGLTFYETPGAVFVHAGFNPERALTEQLEHHLYWEKYVEPTAHPDGRWVICGHTSRKNGEVAHFGHTTCIDTYAYGGQWLTCLNIDERSWIQADLRGRIRKGLLATNGWA